MGNRRGGTAAPRVQARLSECQRAIYRTLGLRIMPTRCRRYSIVDGDDIEQALTAAQAYVASARPRSEAKIVAISEGRR